MNQSVSGVWRCSFGTSDDITPVKLLGAGSSAPLDEGSVSLPFQHKNFSSRITPRGFVVELPMKNDEDFYGFGLQFRSFNQAGRRRFMKVNSDPGTDTGESHAPVPFY
ncbi:MAG: hypothetical protein LBG22_09480 [Treponema sp.]|jgi:alpha-D-xyloside xylohydrolase|nr:hypothetical protein [Treponema sp.]